MSKSKDEMLQGMKMSGEPVAESETVGSEIEDSNLEVAVSASDLAEMKQQFELLMRELSEEREQRAQMAEQLAVMQRNATAAPVFSDGVAPKLLDGREWGPFPDYEFAPTPFGEFAVPLTKVLYFVGVQKVNKDTLQLETQAVPQYRDATEEELVDVKSPSTAPLARNKITPPVTVEEAMKKMIDFFEGRSAPGLTAEPIIAPEVQ